MKSSLLALRLGGPLALACALGCAAAACGDAASGELGEHSSALEASTGPYEFVECDLTPATSYRIDGSRLDLSFEGYYRWNGTWTSGYRGFTFAQPADLVEGETYQLKVTVSNTNVPIPAVIRASLAGAGPEQSLTFFSPGTQTLTFTVGSLAEESELRLTAHPVLGHISHVEGLGIGIQSYTVQTALSLAE
jgi:hypothetical protein